jgi:hypothetical protein
MKMEELHGVLNLSAGKRLSQAKARRMNGYFASLAL